MRINVTAATGQLGERVVNALLAAGVDPSHLSASVRTPAKAEHLARMGVDVRQADYDDAGSLSAAFANTDVLLLIPSLAPVEARIVQHCHALEAARANRVQRVVLASFAAATPTSQFSIAPFLLYAECKLRQSGRDWTIVRDGMYLDPVADWVPQLLEWGYLPYPVRKGRVAYISRDDLARGLAAACLGDSHSGKLYQLTGPDAISMPELADSISRVTSQQVEYRLVSESEFVEICRAGNEPQAMIDALLSMYRAVDNSEFEDVTDHVELLTGRPPESVERFLATRFAKTNGKDGV